MTELENTARVIGELVLEQLAVEKKIGALLDEMSQRARIFARIGRLLIHQPERIVFEGQTVDEQFAGENLIDRSRLDIDSLIADLRAAIVRKKQLYDQLAELGIDPEAAERERDQRNSRNIFHPANDGGASGNGRRGNVGFTKPAKKANC